MEKKLYTVTIAAYATIYVEAENGDEAAEIATAACDNNDFDSIDLDDQLQDSTLEVHSYETIPTDKNSLNRHDLIFVDGELIHADDYEEFCSVENLLQHFDND